MRLPDFSKWYWWLVGLAILGGIFVYLVPVGSTPVGWDAWWNLVVSRSWAEGGFPDAFPAAGFTMLEKGYAEYQLTLQFLLVVVGGKDIGPWLVPWVVLALILGQGLVFCWCLRHLRPGAVSWWVLLPAVMSSTWLFRSTALRGMTLTVIFLLPLMTMLIRRVREPRGGLIGIFVCAALVAYSHSALALPLVMLLLLAVGARLEGGRWLWREVTVVLIGFVFANIARPDFPTNLKLLWTLNVCLPLANLTGEIAAVPTELLPYGLGDLFYWNTPFLIVLGLVIWLVVRGRRPWTLALPVFFLVLAAFASRRMFEVAAPFLALLVVIMVDVRWTRALIVGLVVLALPALFWNVHHADLNAQANRVSNLQDAAEWIKERSQPGDVVFVTDYALVGPLAWATRESGIVFTGWRDPAWMLAWNRPAWQKWKGIKTCEDRHPEQTLREFFKARFLIYHRADALPGRPVGQTAIYLGKMGYRLSGENTGKGMDGQMFGPWICMRFNWE